MRLIERIKPFREKYGITQSEFAELVGTTWGIFNHWENGKTEPNQRAIKERIREVLEGGKPSLVKKQKKRQGKKRRPESQ